MPSAVETANLALLRIGVSTTIDDFGEPTKEARVCTQFYEPTVRLVLEDFDWPFARKRVALAALTTEAPAPWSYAYRYPADCLAFRGLDAGTRIVRSRDRFPYEVASDDDGRVLYCDISPATGIYTAFVSDPVRWPSSFADAVAWRLAMEIAVPMAVAPTLRQDAARYYAVAIAEARAAALREREDGGEPDSEFITVRN